MSKTEFLAQLRARLVGRMGEEEINNALSYYEEYFADAGPDREQEVIEELGTPETVANQVFGEREARYVPPQPRRRSRAGVIALCVGLGVVLIGTVLLFLLSFSGYQLFTREPHVTTVSQAPALAKDPIGTTASAAPEVSAVPEGTIAVGGFTDLNVDIGMGTVWVQSGEAYGLSLRSRGKDKHGTPYELHYSVEEGRLKVWSTPKSLSVDDSTNPEADVVITLPRSAELERAKIEVGMGDLDVSAAAVIQKLTANVGMGDITVAELISKDLELESGMGSIGVELPGSAADYELDLEVGMGSISVDGEKVKNPYEKNDDACNSLDCSAGMGDIKVRFGKE